LSTVRNDEETDYGEEGFGLLYRERKVRARGHMCSAVWREVDPERPTPINLSDEEKSPPLYWIDGEILPSNDYQTFKNPHVRTEFLPCYGIERAAFTGLMKGPLPELKAEVLANQYDPSQLVKSLKPLIDVYATWINEQKTKAKKYSALIEKSI
jgi:hypothetical protein